MRALIDRGSKVVLLTNYPKWAVRRFGVPDRCVQSFWIHGVLSRMFVLLYERLRIPFPEALMHKLFGRWAASQLIRSDVDVVFCFSGVAEEAFRRLQGTGKTTLLARCSAHIEIQRQILESEAKSRGATINRPSKWMIEREKDEYSISDAVVTLSEFARQSFLQSGFPERRLRVMPLGSDVSHFRPSQAVVDERRKRILSGAPLRVIYVGALSYQKGIRDLLEVAKTADKSRLTFRVVGPVDKEAVSVVKELAKHAQLTPKQPQSKLTAQYLWADVFVFPTLQDGYPVVLAQAAASALPIITTPRCSGPDLLGENAGMGWVVPAGEPGLILKQLRWCDEHRAIVAGMVTQLYKTYAVRDWNAVAEDFERIAQDIRESVPEKHNMAAAI